MRYLRVNSDAIIKIKDCFTGLDEYTDFIRGFNETIDDHLFTSSKIVREQDENKIVILTIRQIIVMALYFREHIDLIHQIISVLDCKEISEEEMVALRDNPEMGFLVME